MNFLKQHQYYEKFNKVIKNTIQENVEKLKFYDKIQNNYQNILNKAKNSKRLNNIFENKDTYIYNVLVESTFINEEKMIKVKEFGAGIFINSFSILVPYKNLIFDFNEYIGNADNDRSANKLEENQFNLIELECHFVNLSEEYRQYLPSSIRIVDYLTPLQDNSATLTMEDQITSGWGIVILEYPYGDFLQYVLQLEKNKKYGKKNNLIVNDLPTIKLLNNEEIEKSQILFLEYYKLEKSDNDEDTNLEHYFFFENEYEIKTDENFIFLKDTKLSDCILPGIIIAKSRRKYYLLGMNTKMLIQNPEENEETIRIPIIFNQSNIEKIESYLEILKKMKLDYKFDSNLFEILNSKIKSIQGFIDLISNNCEKLQDFLTNLATNFSIPQSTKKHIDIYDKSLQWMLSLIFNKISNKLIIDDIDFNSLNIGIEGSILLAELLKNKDSLSSLNLRGCNIFSLGVKNLIKPVFNTQNILYLARNLRLLNLDKNKLSSKSMNYLRHLIKLASDIEVISLSQNYLTWKALKQLMNSLKEKQNLRVLNLAFNNFGHYSGFYLRNILESLPNLEYFDIGSNNLTDEPIQDILNGINNCSNLQHLDLSNNNLSKDCTRFLEEYLKNNQSLKNFFINNNDIHKEGIINIISGISKHPSIEKLNLSCLIQSGEENPSFNDINNDQILIDCKNLNYLNLSNNNLDDSSCHAIANIISTNENISTLSLSFNKISDEGVKVLSEIFLQHPSLKELKLSNNLIEEEGGELLLCVALSNPTIQKLYIENNKFDWRSININLKGLREGLEIFY